MQDELEELRQRVAALTDAQATNEAEAVEKLVVGRYSHLFDKAATYANVIVLSGYAGSFTIWTQINTHFGPKTNLWIALSLGISLTTFVFYEVFKMVMNAQVATKTDHLFRQPLPAREFLQRWNEIEFDTRRDGLINTWVWRAVMVVSVGSILIGLGIMYFHVILRLIH